MQYIERDPKMHSIFSTGLVVSQLDFMAKQDSFTHSLARLAKYWLKTRQIEDWYPAGVKNAIELIAVCSAQREGKGKFCGQSMPRAFQRFLDFILNFKTLRIAFNRNGRAFLRKKWVERFPYGFARGLRSDDVCP